MEREECIACIQFSAEQRLQAEFVVNAVRQIESRFDILEGVLPRRAFGFGPGQIEHHPGILEMPRQFVVGFDERAMGIRPADRLAGGVRIVPKSGRGGLRLQFQQGQTAFIDVKDNLASLPVLRATGRGVAALLRSRSRVVPCQSPQEGCHYPHPGHPRMKDILNARIKHRGAAGPPSRSQT